MSEHEEVEEVEPFDVAGYETLADVYTGVGEWGDSWATKQSIIDASYSMLELCKEARRLQALEGRVTDQIAEKKAKLLEKYEDLATCSERGWDEGHERITGEVSVLRGEIKMLEKLLEEKA